MSHDTYEPGKDPYTQSEEAQQPPVVPPVESPVVAEVVPDSKVAGLQHIKQAITLLKTHSASNIAGSMLSDALGLLEKGYAILSE